MYVFVLNEDMVGIIAIVFILALAHHGSNQDFPLNTSLALPCAKMLF